MATIEVRQTSDGPRYDVRYRVDGKQQRRTFRLRRDAESHKRKIESDETAGLLIDPRGGEVAFGSYAAQWLSTRLVKGHPLTPATRQGYRRLLQRNVLPSFGRTPLRKITSERVRQWHAGFVSSAGNDQAAKSYRVLRAILNTAVTDDLIAHNPCRVKGAGIERAPERPFIDTATVLDLGDAIEARLRAFIYLAGFATLRSGELLGLERRDIDLLHAVVHVRREAQEIAHVRDGDGNVLERHGRIVSDPKSEAGKRDVPLPPVVVDELRVHLDSYVAPDPHALVFTRPTGRYLRRADLSTAWRAACDELGLDRGLHPHDLRHHAATVAARMPGLTRKELMTLLGHASERAAAIYQHAEAERLRGVAGHMNDVIAAARSQRTAAVVSLAQ